MILIKIKGKMIMLDINHIKETYVSIDRGFILLLRHDHVSWIRISDNSCLYIGRGLGISFVEEMTTKKKFDIPIKFAKEGGYYYKRKIINFHYI